MSRPLIAALALAAVAAPAAHAAEQVAVRQPWSRPAQAGMNGVGFLTIANTGKTPVVLKSATSPAAGKVEIHLSAMANGVMTMRRQDNGVVVPAGGQLSLAPGGYHLMLMGLKQAQGVGQKVPVTLIFDNGRKIQVELAVQLAAPAAGGAAEHAGHHH